MTNGFVAKLCRLHPLSDEEIAVLSRATSRPREYSTRRDLIREGERPGPVLVILDGWACRYKILPGGTRQILSYLMPGDCCDLHIGLLDQMDHSIQTVTSASVAMIDRAEMDAMLDKYRGIAKALYVSQLIDEGTMRAWITSIGRRASIERVAQLMCELYLRAHNIGLTTRTQFALPLSQLLLADSLRMTPVHLNRVLKELCLAEAIALVRGGLIIAHPGKLAQIAGFHENYLHRRLLASDYAPKLEQPGLRMEEMG